LFKERVIGNWRKSIRMSIRLSRNLAKLTKLHQAMFLGRATTGLLPTMMCLLLLSSCARQSHRGRAPLFGSRPMLDQGLSQSRKTDKIASIDVARSRAKWITSMPSFDC
jgi:hypothetical protein